MITKGKMFAGCALVVLLAAPATAQRQRLLGGHPQPSILRSQSGRQVEVVRSRPEAMTNASLEQEDVETPEFEPVPDEQYDGAATPFDSHFGPSEGCSTCGPDGCDAGCAGGCAGPCDDCGCDVCCCPMPFWAHRSFVFGEYLYLRPLDAQMPYAFQENGVIGPGAVPMGRVGVVDQGFNPAFRAGFGKRLSDCASIVASYSRYQSTGADSLRAGSALGDTVGSLVLHPNSTNAGSTSSLITAGYDIDFQLVNLDYRRVLFGGQRGAANFSLGAAYGKLQQDFTTTGAFSPPSGTIQNTTSITFEGVGLRGGLDGEFLLGCSRFSGYGKGFISVLFGDFRTSYNQVDTLSTIVQADSNWTDGRTVPLLEYEVGIQWTSYNGHWRAATGYYTAFWFNAVTTPAYVRAVQYADFVNVSDTLSFNGLVSRVEYRF